MSPIAEILVDSDKSPFVGTDAEMALFGFVPMATELLHEGRVYDVATPGLIEWSWSLWHVTVISKPYYSKTARRTRGAEWLDFDIEGGLFAQSLASNPAYIREVVA